MAGHGGAPWVKKQQTRNWPNSTDHHEKSSTKRLIVLLVWKVEAHDQKKIFSSSALRRIGASHFQIRYGTMACKYMDYYSYTDPGGIKG